MDSDHLSRLLNVDQGFTTMRVETMERLRAERRRYKAQRNTARFELDCAERTLRVERAALARVRADRDKWMGAWDRLREALTTIIALEGPSSRISDIAAKALAGGKDDDH